MHYIPLCNLLCLSFGVYGLVQATVGVGGVLIRDFCVAYTTGGGVCEIILNPHRASHSILHVGLRLRHASLLLPTTLCCQVGDPLPPSPQIPYAPFPTTTFKHQPREVATSRRGGACGGAGAGGRGWRAGAVRETGAGLPTCPGGAQRGGWSGASTWPLPRARHQLNANSQCRTIIFSFVNIAQAAQGCMTAELCEPKPNSLCLFSGGQAFCGRWSGLAPVAERQGALPLSPSPLNAKASAGRVLGYSFGSVVKLSK